MKLTRSNKLKVCFAAPYTYSLFNTSTNNIFGGSEVRAWLFGTGLAQRPEFSISFTVFDHGQPGMEVYDGVTVYADHYFERNPDKPQESQSWITRLSSKISNHIRAIASGKISPNHKICSFQDIGDRFKTYTQIDADVYCVFGVGDFSAEIVAFCKRHNKRSLLFVGGDGDLRSEYIFEPDDKNEYGSLNRSCAFTLKNADSIICQISTQQDKLKSLFDRDSVVIKNPIELDSIQSHSNTITKKIVLWIGKSDNVKNPLSFVDLAVDNPKMSFTMIMNESNSEIHNKVLSNAPANLMIIEYVTYSQIEKYFSESYILVNTSISEGFPNTFLQACKYGMPILTLNVDPGNVITEHGCGFCARGDHDALSMMLRMLHDDSKIYNKISLKSKKYVDQNHGLTNKIDELSIILKKTIFKISDLQS